MAQHGFPGFSEALRRRIAEFRDRYPDRRSAIMPGLYAVQEAFGHVPDAAIKDLAACLDIPPIQVAEALSFYTMYRRRAAGRHEVWVCRTLSCELGGCRRILAAIQEAFAVGPGETTADGKLTVRTWECLGACDLAPVVQIGREYLKGTTPAEVVDRLKRLE